MTTDEILLSEKQRRLDEMIALQTCKWCSTFGPHRCSHWIAKGPEDGDNIEFEEFIQ